MEKLTAWISENIPVVAGAVFAFLISILTNRRGGIIDRLTGAVLCSLLSTGIFYGLTAVLPACPAEAAVAIGSFVGFYGVDEVKRLVMDRIKYVLTPNKKAEDDNQDQQ